ncbi:hypothetical protein CBR64_06880 [Cellulosimicrobium cellulans]|uniref:Uncharacterized protein n=1 Tax=Cellulosimicrobium cellulans TaxID=1710 RepID=A0A1Y0HSW3_CELCE|nr:hypothetical protein CBR64_06880 [Cellulosimicrobium cellulans]
MASASATVTTRRSTSAVVTAGGSLDVVAHAPSTSVAKVATPIRAVSRRLPGRCRVQVVNAAPSWNCRGVPATLTT